MSRDPTVDNDGMGRARAGLLALVSGCVAATSPVPVAPAAMSATAGAPLRTPDAPPVTTASTGDAPTDEPAAVDPGTCVPVAAVRDVTSDLWGPVLTDLAQHIPDDNPWYLANLVTAAHESTHVVNARIAAAHAPDDGTRIDGFYLLGDCGVVVREPALRKRDVAPYVPPALRGLRFGVYITDPAWDHQPTYILDEWVAYTNGGAAALELVARGQWTTGPQDAMAGQLEFTIYAIALTMAIADRDPDYLAANPAYTALVERTALRALTQFRAGKDLPAFPSEEQDRLYQALRVDPEGEPLRQFCRATWGDGFTRALLDL